MRVFRLDREAELRELREAVRRLVEKFPQIRLVKFFGSWARGEAGVWSDFDVLVVVEREPLPFPERFGKYIIKTKREAQVFVYTQEEIERMLREGNPFVEEALKGITLFER